VYDFTEYSTPQWAIGDDEPLSNGISGAMPIPKAEGACKIKRFVIESIMVGIYSLEPYM
jgi:hypothetical protein